MVYTESELNGFKKDVLVKIVLEQQATNEQLQILISKVKNLEEKIEQIQSINSVKEKTSDLLVKRVKDLETSLLKAEQYSRRECLDITGIDRSVADSQIEGEVCGILASIGVNFQPEKDVQACHRYGKRGAVIIKFSNRKSVHKILSLKSNLPNGIYANETLCPRNKCIRGRCGILKKNGLISNVVTKNGMIRIKKLDNNYVDINHEDDIVKLFPDFVFPF